MIEITQEEYEQDEAHFKTLEEFASNLIKNQKPLEPEFEKVLFDNFWDLLD